jgi:CRP/FNR family transcriptional regulator, cyclic AMP receptor protein
MISPEVIRRYPFFSFMTVDQRREVAMIADEVEAAAGETIFAIGDKAETLFLLTQGAVDLHYIVVDEHEPALRKDFMVGTVNPGEILGISALVEPYEMTTSAVAIQDCKLLKINAVELRRLSEHDQDLALGLQKKVAQVTMERLHATRVQLAAATAPE